MVHDWRLKNGKPLVKKRDFSSVLDQAIGAIKPETIRSGFRKCGLCPWNPKEPIKSLRLKENPILETPETDSTVRETSQQSGKKETKAALELIHQYVGTAKIKLFEASHEWSGCTEDKSLFLLWKAIKLGAIETTQEAIETTNLPCGSNEETGAESSSMTQRDDYEEPKEITVQGPVASSSEQQMLSPISTNSSSTPSTRAQNVSTSIITPCRSNPNIPSPFKSVLLWPELPEKKTKRRQETLPSVVTSKSRQEYHFNKAKKKLDMEERKKSRAEEREKKKIAKQELLLKRKATKKTKKTPKNNKIKNRRKQNKKISTSESEECEWEPSDESVCSADVEPLEDMDGEVIDGSLPSPAPAENYTPQEHSANLVVTQNIVGEPKLSDEVLIANILNVDGLDIGPYEIYATFDDEPHQEKEEAMAIEEATHFEASDERMEVNQPTDEQNLTSEPKPNSTSPEIDHQEEIHGNPFEVGNFIVATLSNRNREVESVCRIESLGSDERFLVQTMRPINRLRNVFHLNQKDERLISRSQILKILPNPVQLGSGFQFQ